MHSIGANPSALPARNSLRPSARRTLWRKHAQRIPTMPDGSCITSRRTRFHVSMRINGEWSVGDDGMVRPTLRGEILAADGSWVQAPFLVDTGADCTVLSASVWTALGFHPYVTGERLGGVGGV